MSCDRFAFDGQESAAQPHPRTELGRSAFTKRFLPALTAFGALTMPVLEAQVPVWSQAGFEPSAHAGLSLAVIGDLDGDLIDDVLIGMPTGSAGSPLTLPTPSAAGKAIAVSGKTGTVLRTFQGPGIPQDLFGYAVCGAGDIDLDGFVDVAIGAPRDSSALNAQAGSISVYSGASGAQRYRVFGLSQNEAYGAALAGLGDTNFDGIPELLAGAPYADPSAAIDGGVARMLFGSNGTPLKTLSGALTLDHFGSVLASLPGVASSFSAPFIIGAPDAEIAPGVRAGAAALYSAAGTFVAKYPGANPGDRFGASFATIGDLDQDGKSDILVGAPGADGTQSGAGRIYGFSYQNGALTVTKGGVAGEAIGSALSSSVDLDADGVPEIVTATALGEVKFMSLAGSVHGSYAIPGGFGSALVRIEDVDADAKSDYVIAAPFASQAGIDQSGAVGIYPGPASAGLPAFSATALQFDVGVGSIPDAKTIDVVNKGFGAVGWKLVKPADAAWLTLSPTSGSLADLGDLDPVEVAIDVGKLVSVDSTASVSLVDAATNAVFAKLTVQVIAVGGGANSDLCVSTTTLHTLTPIGGSNPQPSVFTISNCGNPALSLAFDNALVEPDVTWVTPVPAHGTVAPAGSQTLVKLFYDVSALAPGTYTAHLRSVNSANPADFEQIEITLVISAGLLVPGQKVKGAILDALDRDEAVFYGIDGMEFVVTGGPKQGFKPRLTLIDPNGDTFETWVPANEKTKKSVLLAGSGAWLLQVSGDGAAGSYQFKTKRGFLPSSAKASTATITAANTLPIPLDLLALPGCKLDAKITPKTQPLGDLAFSFQLPNGSQFDASQFDSVSNSTYLVKKLPLLATGEYSIVVSGLQLGKQMKVVLEPTQPPAGKGTIVID